MLWADDGEWHLSPVTETKCLKLNHVSAKWLRVGLKKMHVGFFFLNLNDWNYPIFLPQYQQHMIILFCYRFFFFLGNLPNVCHHLHLADVPSHLYNSLVLEFPWQYCVFLYNQYMSLPWHCTNMLDFCQNEDGIKTLSTLRLK